MQRLVSFLLIVLVFVSFVGCAPVGSNLTLAPVVVGIHSTPPAADFGRGNLETFPSPNGKPVKQYDLRGYDLSQVKMDDKLDSLLIAEFDSVTRWPNVLPSGFNPELIMELGKDPGLGIRSLHERGITGKGVSVAIIDQPLQVDHVEYKDQLVHYEEIHNLTPTASMHGAALASLAVGKTVGVAPEARLYYIAETHADVKGDKVELNFTYLAKSLDRVVEINKLLPEGEKIRVVAIPVGWSPFQKGYNAIMQAVKRAKEQGIFVVASCIEVLYDNKFHFNGMSRSPYLDPNDPKSYGPGLFWAEQFYKRERSTINTLMIPMDSRCTASPTGVEDYVYYYEGGWSWAIPYIAGLYALACQVDPSITPEVFWSSALKSGDIIQIEKNGQIYELGKIANPLKLVETLSSR